MEVQIQIPTTIGIDGIMEAKPGSIFQAIKNGEGGPILMRTNNDVYPLLNIASGYLWGNLNEFKHYDAFLILNYTKLTIS